MNSGLLIDDFNSIIELITGAWFSANGVTYYFSFIKDETQEGLLLVLLAVLLLFLVIVVLVVIIISEVDGVDVKRDRFRCRALGGIALGELGGFTLLGALVVFPGVEDHVQPRHHLLDRRQLSGRAGFTARAGRSLRSLWTSFAARTLHAVDPVGEPRA